jgi:hypothetical protein
LQGLLAYDTNFTPEASQVQAFTIQLFRDAAEMTPISSAPRLGISLLADEHDYQGSLAQLSDDHWTKEVTDWESISWTGIQLWLSDYAVGSNMRNPLTANSVNVPKTAAEKQLCRAMKMKKSGGFS